MPDFDNQFFLDITEAIEYSALQRGYQLLLCNSRRQPLVEEAHIRQLAEQGIEGAILAHDPQLPFPASHSYLESANIPYVALFSAPSSANCDSIAVDDYAGANQAMRYLFSLGHRNIAFCSPTDGAAPHPRQKAYQEIMTLSGLPTPEHFFIPRDALDDMRGREYLSKILSCSPVPKAIFDGNDRTPLVLQKRLTELGISVPTDLSIIGFDNLRLTEHLPVPLTTIDQPKFEMGRRAVDFLLERIEFGHALEPRKEMFEPHLVIRESCGMAPSHMDHGPLVGQR